MRVMGNVTEHFAVPHPAPAEVEKASAKFEEMTAAFQEARATYYRLLGSRLDDIQKANTASAAARIKGTKSTARTEAKIDADIARAKDEMDVLAEATDQAGNALLEAVTDHRDEWFKVYEAAEVEAGQRIDELIALQERATSDLSNARAASRWLREFTASGSQSQFPGSGRSGHTLAAFSELEKLVHGELRLVGYRDSQPIWETVKS
jgi:hypothetical protein